MNAAAKPERTVAPYYLCKTLRNHLKWLLTAASTANRLAVW